MNSRPADALDTCTNCPEWVRYGQSWRPTTDGIAHDTCPTPAHASRERVRLHTRARTIPGRRA